MTATPQLVRIQNTKHKTYTNSFKITKFIFIFSSFLLFYISIAATGLLMDTLLYYVLGLVPLPFSISVNFGLWGFLGLWGPKRF
jgi:hypothetical protein